MAALAQSNYEILNRSEAETSETAEDVSSMLVNTCSEEREKTIAVQEHSKSSRLQTRSRTKYHGNSSGSTLWVEGGAPAKPFSVVGSKVPAHDAQNNCKTHAEKCRTRFHGHTSSRHDR